MKTISIKFRRFFFYAVIFCLTSSSLVAQTAQSGYFIESLQSRSSLNPAFRPKQGYIGLPLLSNLYIDSKTNTFSLDKFIFPQGNGEKSLNFMNEAIPADKFLSGISNNNYLDFNLSYTMLAIGWRYKEKSFWTIDLGIKTHVDVNIPKELFRLAKQGFSSDLNAPIRYKIENMQMTANSYLEWGIGYSRSFLDNEALTLGLKAKILTGIGDVNVNINELTLEAGEDEWVARSRATLQGSAMGIRAKYDKDGKFDSVDIDDDGFSFSGHGLGFDIGGVYNLNKDLTFSLALTDIGFISWSKKNSLHLKSPETEVSIPGDDVFVSDADNSLGDHIEDVAEDLKDVLDFQETAQKGRTTSLRTNLNAGVEYSLLENRKISVGLASCTYFNPSHTATELTLAGNFRPASWFTSALTYSFMHSQFKTFGLALHLAPKVGPNLFLASDYVFYHKNSDWLPTTSKGANFQLGISFPL